ncbi:MAG: hypothetical protein QG602_1686 [Verrucomicrobiota bacterium]|nr:hypothetical protein [Verrucomicrobiota bacterium]
MAARLLFTVLCLTLAPVLAAASDLTIVRVYNGWRDAASFKRISEYFDGKENTGGEAVLRTRPDQRGGYYFLVRVTNPSGARAVTARLQVITQTDAQPQTFTFTPALKAGDTVFHLGLTGADWTDPKADPVAWKLELTDADGKTLATEKSYLWEKPAGK